jgi:hypothetical protein
VWATGVRGASFSVYVNDIAYHNGRVYFAGEHFVPAWGGVGISLFICNTQRGSLNFSIHTVTATGDDLVVRPRQE